MYFSDITNSELIKYHQKVKNNFELPFTEIINSDLFKVETIISDAIYKIYPLFYCEEITSTNPNDQILENKLLIVEKNINTLVSFTTNIPFSNTIQGRWDVNLTNFGIVIYVYDGITGNSIENAQIEATSEQEVNYTLVTYDFSGVTDVNGIFYQPTETGFSSLNLDALKITLPDGTVIVDYERGE